MIKIFEIAMSGFWEFMGTLIILALIFQVALHFYTRGLRFLMVWKRGWSPPHLDADGDAIEQGKEVENEEE